jgi:hypothetical protein
VRRRISMVFLCTVIAGSVLAGAALGQGQKKPRLKAYFTTKRAPNVDIGTVEGAMASSAMATSTLPLWTFDVTASRDGNTHSGVMVGRNPFNDPGSVSVPTNVVPLIIVTRTVGTSVNATTGAITTQPGVTTFNPTVADTACLAAPNNIPTKLLGASPLFQPATFDFGGTVVGTTEYDDAFQRGNFWKVLSKDGDDYHVLLDPVKFLAPVIITVPATGGLALATSALGPPASCAPLGIVDINWFDSYVTGTVLPALAKNGVNPTNFPILLVHNVVWASPVTNLFRCCTIGYHGSTGVPVPTQTYSPADFDSTGLFSLAFEDTAALSHEVAEWINDPFVVNEVPPWGHIGEEAGCDNLLEVGDPLAGTQAPPIAMPNGFTYHLQELAFFSWFMGAPSIAVNGWYSNNGTFLSDAGPPCH